MTALPPSSKKTGVLYGNVSHCSSLAILLIDVINAFDFPGSETLLEQSIPMAREIAAVSRAARRRGIPVIYANDNFGRWRSDLNAIVRACVRGKGKQIVKLLQPTARDYFVLKPKNSAFYTTTLELLLRHIGVKQLVLTGLLADNCILFSANDAYLRDYKIIVPSDCVASLEVGHKEIALDQMQRVLKADIRPWKTSVKFRKSSVKRNEP